MEIPLFTSLEQPSLAKGPREHETIGQIKDKYPANPVTISINDQLYKSNKGHKSVPLIPKVNRLYYYY